MKKQYLLVSFLLALTSSFVSCQSSPTNAQQTPTTDSVDVLVINANVYTVNDKQTKAEAFAIKDGKFVAVGSSADLKQRYTSIQTIDAQGKTIVPGLIDAHCHFYNLGLKLQQVNLVGTKSFEEVINRVIEFQKEKNTSSFIVGGGWDQNDWEDKEFPTKDKLDELFPGTPIVLTRIDGHAMLVNQKALDLAEITTQTKVTGGEILKKNGKLTGVLIDNPMELIERIIPAPTRKAQINALKEAEKINFSYGLTTLDDAGLSPQVIELIDSLQKADELKIRVYAMVSNTPQNVAYYLEKGVYKTSKLNVSSFKIYSDGALGSRGAALKKPYADKHNHYGAMVISYEEFNSLAQKLANSPFQMNTHAIGDSANAVVISTYKKVLANETNRRWRVEHAQVLASEEFAALENNQDNLVISVQPTHATSDMYWAGERLGEERLKGAYAYKDLLTKTGKLALGTDYPVEQVNPFYTFYAAVARKDLENYPENGFQKENALSREETLKGMTLWAAFSNFEENEKGSIEVGKYADFVILSEDIMQVEEAKIPTIQAEATYIDGKKVYELK